MGVCSYVPGHRVFNRFPTPQDYRGPFPGPELRTLGQPGHLPRFPCCDFGPAVGAMKFDEVHVLKI